MMASSTQSSRAQTPVPMPVRLAPIVRAPDREEKNVERRVQQQSVQSSSMQPDLTIFVNSSECRHSVDLLRDIRDVHRVPCTVVDISNGAEIPSWLKGTPSIVVGTDVYCGDTAFQLAESIFINHANTSPHPTGENTVSGALPFADIISGKGGKSKDRGCGLSEAFCAPTQISEEEAQAKYSGSVDDAMARLMQARG